MYILHCYLDHLSPLGLGGVTNLAPPLGATLVPARGGSAAGSRGSVWLLASRNTLTWKNNIFSDGVIKFWHRNIFLDDAAIFFGGLFNMFILVVFMLLRVP